MFRSGSFSEFVATVFILFVSIFLAAVGCMSEPYYTFTVPTDARVAADHDAEAKAARIGQQTASNREACLKLEPGDIILYLGKLWSVRNDNACNREGSYGIRHLGSLHTTVLDTTDNWAMSPVRFKHIYKLDTKEWYQAAVMLNLQGLPSQPITTEVLKHIYK